MSDTIIKIENLSKQYRLGVVGTRTLSGDVQRWMARIRGKEDPFLKIGEENKLDSRSSEYIWALRDINIEVKRGEVLGIIGKNGAGKSTLLKILSRVTGPTTGSIKTFGRIASLLEVGTGFHPELTGRENIFLNGAIMGMNRHEVRVKLDEIVAFAGVEKYLDTPVKRYSSGMHVRLAFAVAAHLEPDILVVDEVLAVGDAEFQKKAIGKMREVSQGEGRTVLFVSHNMASVKALCSKAIILENGKVKMAGTTDECVSIYLSANDGMNNYKTLQNNKDFENENIVIHEIGIKAKNKPFSDIMNIEDELEFFVKYSSKLNYESLHTTLHLKDETGSKLFSTAGAKHTNNEIDKIYRSKVTFPSNFFNWGNFYIDLHIINDRKNLAFYMTDILSFTLVNSKVEIGGWMGKEPGSIHPNFKWELL